MFGVIGKSKTLLKGRCQSETSFNILLLLLWAGGLYNFAMVATDMVLHTGMFIRTIGKVLLCIVLFLYSINYMQGYVKSKHVVALLLYVLFYYICFFNPDATDYLIKYQETFLWAIPMFFIGLSIDISRTKELLYYASILEICISSYYLLSFTHSADYSGSAEFLEDNMNQAYGFLTPLIYLVWYIFETFSIKSIRTYINIAVIFLGFFTMSVLGTRGPIICLLIFCLLYILLFKINKHRIAYLLFFSACVFVVNQFLESFLIYMELLSDDLGFSARVFTSFLNDDFASSEGTSGRTDIYAKAWILINDSPAIGYGFFGYNNKLFGHYAHNFVLDVLLTFGYGIGIPCLMYLFWMTAKSFLRNISYENKSFLLVLFGAGIISLFFSNTFVVSKMFYLFIGYAIQVSSRPTREYA